jgi:hypothetical protein
MCSLILFAYAEIRNKLNTGNAYYNSVSTIFFLLVCYLKTLKIKTQKAVILLCCILWVWNLVSHIKGGALAEGAWKQGAERNICT